MDKINFENLPSTNTAVSAENLNQVQNNVEAALENKVNVESGKGLSTNDFTNTYKTKLDGIATGATKNTVENSLTSTSTTNALSAYQGKVLNTSISNLKPVSLFDNSSGITGNVTLSESAANFAYLEIFYGRSSARSYTKINSPNGKTVSLSNIWRIDDTGIQIQAQSATISGTTITRTNEIYLNLFNGSSPSGGAQKTLLIYKVVGYR